MTIPVTSILGSLFECWGAVYVSMLLRGYGKLDLSSPPSVAHVLLTANMHVKCTLKFSKGVWTFVSMVQHLSL